jgi:hypothetical protein
MFLRRRRKEIIKDILDFVEDYPCRRVQRRIRIAAAIALADGSEWDVVGRIYLRPPPLTREPFRSRNRGRRRLPVVGDNSGGDRNVPVPLV